MSFDTVELKPREAIGADILVLMANLEVEAQVDVRVRAEVQFPLISFNSPARENN
jgi:hypothetical protein